MVGYMSMESKWLRFSPVVRKLLGLFGVAGFVVSQMPLAEASVPDERARLEARVEAARAILQEQSLAPGPDREASRLTQWFNWPNWGNWGNWGNWRNW